MKAAVLALLFVGLVGCEATKGQGTGGDVDTDSGAELAEVGSDTGNDCGGAATSACSLDHFTVCPVANGAQEFGYVFGLDALPSGPCCTTEVCRLGVNPCPNWQAHPGERVDDYGCVCANGEWACEVCMMGNGICLESR